MENNETRQITPQPTWNHARLAFVPDSCQCPSHLGHVVAVQCSDTVHVVVTSGS